MSKSALSQIVMALAILVLSDACLASDTGTLVPGGTFNFGTAASGDPSPDAIDDVSGYTAGVTAIHLLSPSGWAYSSFSGSVNAYTNSSLADAQAAGYNTDYAAGHGFIPDDYSSNFTVYYMRTGSGGSVKYFKMHTNGTNTASGLPLLWDYLGAGAPNPPASEFTFDSYDLITNFHDSSTGGTPTSWSWDFGDGSGTSSQQSPRYRYASAATYSACLTASNSGGGGGNTCHNVALSTVPSTTAAVNASFDLDGDTLGDMQVLGPGCGVIVNQLHMQNGAKYALLYKDYRNITASDIGGGPASSGDFCVNVDYLEGFLVKSSNGAVYKAWTAANDAGGIRLEFSLLQAGPPPVPVSSFSFSSYDLIVDFTDTSTNTPNAWSWAFGDTATSMLQNPRNRFGSADTYNVCLTASNSGGPGNNACNDVTVSTVPSTTVAVNGAFDFDSDGQDDLQVLGPGCGVIVNQLHPLNGATYTLLSKDYRNVAVADIIGDPAGTSDFCVDVDFLAPFLVETTSGAIYKAWTAANDAGGIRMEFALLQAAPPPVPVSSFTSSSYDLIVDFTDTSSNAPNAWSWTFGDGNVSSNQYPRHRYDSAGTHNACLTASNSGGAGNNACNDVTLSTVPSTTVAVNGTFDLDGDSLPDMQVLGGSCAPIVNKLHMLNGSAYALLAMDYRNVTSGDIGGGPVTTADFCVSVDYLAPFLVQTSLGAIYKAWTAANDANGIRMEFALLQAAPPPVPVSSFTASSYDLIVDFTDTSTNTPNAWSWTFGDGGTSTQQNPRYRYASAGMHNACLIASNSGGSGNNACSNVSVATVASTLVAGNGTFDLDGDSMPDLQVLAPGCPPTSYKLHVSSGVSYTLLAKDYRNVTAADIVGTPASTGDFCTEVDYFKPFLVQTTDGAIYKAWTPANDGNGIRMQFALLQVAPPPVPVSGFTSSSYDLIVSFTDTSTQSPNAWAWTFGDGGTSTQQNPTHRYASAGMRNACLTAANAGGSGNQACHTISTSLRPSTTVTTASGIDFDNDNIDDLFVSAPSGCAVLNKLTPIDEAEYALLNKDYRTLSVADAKTALFSKAATGFCVGVDYNQSFLVLSSLGSIYRAWTAANDASAVRIEYSLLLANERVFAGGFD